MAEQHDYDQEAAACAINYAKETYGAKDPGLVDAIENPKGVVYAKVRYTNPHWYDDGDTQELVLRVDQDYRVDRYHTPRPSREQR